MRREREAVGLLNKLLDRHERSRGDRRIIERPAQSFDDPGELRALSEGLKAAADVGAVGLAWDRDASHLVAQAILTRPDELYPFFERTPGGQIAARASDEIRKLRPTTEPARALIVELVDAWERRTRVASVEYGTATRVRHGRSSERSTPPSPRYPETSRFERDPRGCSTTARHWSVPSHQLSPNRGNPASWTRLSLRRR